MSLHSIAGIMQVIAVCVVLITAVACVWFYWFFKVRKKKRVQEIQIDYESLNKFDSLDFCKFEDIKDDMIITNNGTRFVGVIKARGFDYFQSKAVERNSAEAGYATFINMLSEPTTFRQYTKAVDLDGVRDNYKAAYDRVEQTLFNLSDDFNRLTEQYYNLKENNAISEETEYEILNQCEEIAARIDVYNYRRLHLADNLDYIDQTSKITSPEKIQTYVFDWEYNPLLGVTDLSDEEIHKRAVTELKRKADSYIHALGNAGVRASRVHTPELLQMFRRHYHPVTANVFTQKDFESSNYYDEITASSGMKESDYELAEEQGVLEQVMDQKDKIYNNMVESGVDSDVAEKITDTYDIEALGAAKAEEEGVNVNVMTGDSIEDRKKEILRNKFEESEKQRLKAEKERKDKEKRQKAVTGKSPEKKQVEDHIYTGLDFDLPDIDIK